LESHNALKPAVVDEIRQGNIICFVSDRQS
jgi:hypothetical protein